MAPRSQFIGRAPFTAARHAGSGGRTKSDQSLAAAISSERNQACAGSLAARRCQAIDTVIEKSIGNGMISISAVAAIWRAVPLSSCRLPTSPPGPAPPVPPVLSGRDQASPTPFNAVAPAQRRSMSREYNATMAIVWLFIPQCGTICRARRALSGRRFASRGGGQVDGR